MFRASEKRRWVMPLRRARLQFHRIQFTSDLLPSDVLGVSVYSPKLNEFEFKRTNFREHCAGRRNQSNDAENSERAARGDERSRVTIENVTYRAAAIHGAGDAKSHQIITELIRLPKESQLDHS